MIYILKITNVCQDDVKQGKNRTDELFYFLRGVITVGKIMLKCVESRVSKLFIKRALG